MRPPSHFRMRFALWTTAFFFLAVMLYGAFVFATMSVFLHASFWDSLRVASDQAAGTLEV
jgi:hypothetical protein